MLPPESSDELPSLPNVVRNSQNIEHVYSHRITDFEFGGSSVPTDPEDRHIWERHIGCLSSHEYFSERVLPLLRSMECEAPTLQRKYTIVQILNMVAASLATVLGATGQTSWIPIAVSASTVLTSFLEHFKFKVRLNSTTQAMGELRALVSFCAKLSDWKVRAAFP